MFRIVNIVGENYCTVSTEQYNLVVKPTFMLSNSICKDDLSCQNTKKTGKQPLCLIQHCIDYDIETLTKVYHMSPWM